MSVYPRLEVCRDYIDNKCNRDENSCRFAHPPESIRISNGMVICCADSLQGKCNREDPPCRYFHPPQHLKGRVKRVTASGQPENDRRRSSSYSRGSRDHSRSPRFQDDFHRDTNFYNDHDERDQSDMKEKLLENIVINSMIPQLLILKEQLLSGLKGTLDNNGNSNNGNMDPLAQQSFYDNTGSNNNFLDYRNDDGFRQDSDFRNNNYDSSYRSGDRDSWSRESSPSRRDDTFEVCRDFLNDNCNRSECRFAHPPSNLHVDRDNRVTICLNNLKQKCKFDDCRYYHLPEHLVKIYRRFQDGPPRKRQNRFSNNDIGGKRRRSDY